MSTDNKNTGMLRWLWLAAVVILLDQITKNIIVANFVLGERLAVMPMFNLTLAYNQGAAFSFLADAGGWQRWFFTFVAVAASTLLTVWLWKLPKTDRWMAVALSLILGGALGNLYDRIALGHVVDFLDFYWEPYHFPAFNVADTAITIGAAMVILDIFLQPRREHAAQK